MPNAPLAPPLPRRDPRVKPAASENSAPKSRLTWILLASMHGGAASLALSGIAMLGGSVFLATQPLFDAIYVFVPAAVGLLYLAAGIGAEILAFFLHARRRWAFVASPLAFAGFVLAGSALVGLSMLGMISTPWSLVLFPPGILIGIWIVPGVTATLIPAVDREFRDRR